MAKKTQPAASAIEVDGARTHNLKGISCRIPHGRVTVVTGPSGAGKSSLAFDTVFAEGQRRFVESMSTYARQFLERLERAPVDDLRNVQPAVALEARNSVKNARSTVGTLTEVYDVLRLLFAELGEISCPAGHGGGRSYSPEQAADEVLAGAVGFPCFVVARVPRPRRQADTAVRELVRQGFARRLEGEAVVRLRSNSRWPATLNPLDILTGRLRDATTSRQRVVEALEEAYRLHRGRAVVIGPDGVRHYSSQVGCPVCGVMLARPSAATFSFNSPLGACRECQGFGRIIGVDRGKVIPDPSLTLDEKPIAPWNSPAYEGFYDKLWAACRAVGVPLNVPWAALAQSVQEWVWTGELPTQTNSDELTGGLPKFMTLNRFFARLERRSYKVHLRVLLARYRSYEPCPACLGRRLRPEALAVRLHGRRITELVGLSVKEFRRWLADEEWAAPEIERGGPLLQQLERRVEVLHRVGLGYLTLERQSRTLSGGETQRIHLAASLGAQLTSTLYVLDEPTVGLHPRDSGRLLSLLQELATQGNTVLVVEHEPLLIEGADHIIDLGPTAGEGGGYLMAEGPLSEVLKVEESATTRFLRRPVSRRARDHAARRRREKGRATASELLQRQPRVVVRNAKAHNLTGFDVEFPLGSVTAVTGVSGSGKSTLVDNVLYGNASPSATDFREVGVCDGVEGLELLSGVVLVDQQPLGRSSRSNPVTYVKAYDLIRKAFAETLEAKAAGITAGHFSFNVPKGRCPTCQGTGVQEMDMHFMEPVRVSCDDCDGQRFQPSILEVRLRGHNIADVLRLTVDEAVTFFADNRPLTRRLGDLQRVGLGYLRLGQSTTTLSGGEAQRLKLASFLRRKKTEGRALFLFDEPTTGLHLADVEVLYRALRALADRGDGVVVVEHNLELIRRVDWVIDLGPGGGVEGGELLYSGPLSEFLDGVATPTADELRTYLSPPRAAPLVEASA